MTVPMHVLKKGRDKIASKAAETAQKGGKTTPKRGPVPAPDAGVARRGASNIKASPLPPSHKKANAVCRKCGRRGRIDLKRGLKCCYCGGMLIPDGMKTARELEQEGGA